MPEAVVVIFIIWCISTDSFRNEVGCRSCGVRTTHVLKYQMPRLMSSVVEHTKSLYTRCNQS